MDNDYVVRSWRDTPAGHPTITVVDLRGRRVHVTIPRRLTTAVNVRHVVERTLATRPPAHPDHAR